MSRRKRNRRAGDQNRSPAVNHYTSAAVGTPELTAAQYDTTKVASLRCIMAYLDEDEEMRNARLLVEFAKIHDESPGMLWAVCGYLLAHMADGLVRSYGGREGAIDEVSGVLARAVLEASDDGQ